MKYMQNAGKRHSFFSPSPLCYIHKYSWIVSIDVFDLKYSNASSTPKTQERQMKQEMKTADSCQSEDHSYTGIHSIILFSLTCFKNL